MYYSLFKNKKRIITCIAVIMILLFSYIISSKIIYDEWFVTDWGSVEGEKRIESIGDRGYPKDLYVPWRRAQVYQLY